MASTGELWLVDFGEPFPGEPGEFRPALILGPPETFGQDFPFVIVAPLTTTVRALAIHVEVESGSGTGLDETSFVRCELISSISRRRLVHRLGTVGPEVAHRVTTVVKTLLDH